MRVAFVTIEYPPRIIGGAGMYAYELTRRLGKMGHECKLFIPRQHGDEDLILEEGVDACYVDVDPRLPIEPQFWLKLPKAIRREGPFDVLHLNSFNYLFLWRRRLAKCPHIMTLHHLAYDAHAASGWGLKESLRDPKNEDGPFMQFIEGSCVRSVDHFLAVSENTKVRAVEHYGIAEQKVTIVHNGTERIPPASSDDGLRFRKRFDLPPGPLLLFVGRYEDRRKGLDILLKAMTHLPTDVRLLVVGRGDAEIVQQRARQLGIEERIHFAGFIREEELPYAYASADICVVPSRLEGFGLTAATAMAAGRPVIASKVGALPEIVRDEEQLFPSEDHVELAKRINGLLRHPERAASMGQRNRGAVRALPTWDDTAQLVARVYQRALNEAHGSLSKSDEIGSKDKYKPLISS